jgi:hypothetical protein
MIRFAVSEIQLVMNFAKSKIELVSIVLNRGIFSGFSIDILNIPLCMCQLFKMTTTYHLKLSSSNKPNAQHATGICYDINHYIIFDDLSEIITSITDLPN